MRRRDFLSSAAAGPAVIVPVEATQAADDPESRIQREEHRFDVFVAGGGMAGVCAAISAARHGARAGLVQDRPVFGGNSSSEIRVRPAGSARNNAWARETGVIEEFMLRDLASNYAKCNSNWDLILYDAVRRQAGLTSFLNTRITEVKSAPTQNGHRRIEAIHATQLATEKNFVFTADQYVDATGDATVGFLAGADFRYGAEPRSEFKEPLAPVRGGDVSLGATIGLMSRNIGRPVPYEAPPWVETYRRPEDFGPGRRVSRGGDTDGWWWLSVGAPHHQVYDTPEVRDELLRQALGIWNYIKNYSPDKAAAANYALEWVGMVPGKRESRRLMGDVLLTEADCHQDRKWPDRVCYAGWDIDLHVRGNVLNRKDPPERAIIDAHYKHWITVAPFSIPLRAFYSRNIDNLWMAGRDMSVTHVALGPVRVQQTTASHGQAVGTSAAYAFSHKLTPRQTADPEGKHIRQVQQILLRNDVRIPGLRNGDVEDFARTATVKATSESPLAFGGVQPGEFRAFTTPLAQVFPVTHGRIDTLELYMKNAGTTAELQVEIQELERIWDRTEGKTVATAKVAMDANSEAWVPVPLNARVRPGRPYRCCVRGPEHVAWVQAAHYPTGTVAQFLHISPGGIEAKNRHLPSFQLDEIDLPPYRHWITQRGIARSLKVAPAPLPYAAANVNNGVAWPIDMPNVWVSDPAAGLPQSVEVQFEGERTVDTVLVGFDTDLDPQTNTKPPFWKPSTCARHWRLFVMAGGKWRNAYEEEDNYLRRRTATFDPIATTALKLEVLATNGDPSARVYEIRAYDSRRI
ncbi:MAG TPA: FAD-dependent oxidoreductase [Bryobacteraceae bacterium]|nr:FAD-dependent oxidoreductase [Bryobacteraceae bacterium]